MAAVPALDGGTLEAILAEALDLDAHSIYLRAPIRAARAARAGLRARGVTVCGVGCDDLAALESAADVAAALRADAVVLAQRAHEVRDREAEVDVLARALHGPLRRGVPLGVRTGGVLGAEETGWLLSALPRLAVWFDPATAEAPSREAEAFGPRCAGVFVRGRGPSGHPEDDGPDWGSLADILPTRVPWVLEMAPASASAEIRDGLGALRAILGRHA